MSAGLPPPMSAPEALDTLSFPLWGSRLIEASAGTGKTYTIASLYVRLVLGHGMLPEQRPLAPPDILVVTFTRAATRELRDRIRRRLNEAAACFLGEAQGDPFLQALKAGYDHAQWPGCAYQLQMAAQWMDDAAVSTIDAWCYRMLREHAFDSASLFNVEMDVDAAETVTEATHDYWRLYIAPLPADDFSQVSHVIGGADRLAAALHRSWLAHADLYPASQAPAQRVAEMRSRLQACKQPWPEWVPQMRELLQQADEAKHVDKRQFQSRWWGSWLDQLWEWAHNPQAIQPFSNDRPWTRLSPGGLAEVWKTGQPPQHPGFQALEGLRDELRSLNSHLSAVWMHAASWVRERVAELRQQRAMLDFNGLLEQLDAALQGTNGERLAQQIRRQFPAALIDEFQDTNPIQYRIFDRIYDVDSNNQDGVLTLIGDPKQAIYGFRGADIHAYLAARRACEGRIYTLGSNYRSSAGMVAAVNHLFDVGEQQRPRGAFLFKKTGEAGAVSNPVPFMPVSAARDPGEFLVHGEPVRALTLWHDTLPEKRSNDIRREDVAAACATQILHYLQSAQQGQAGFRTKEGWQPLQARDIAILVNTGTEADSLRAQLAARGIRSVYLSDRSSVFTTEAAAEVLAWLRACAEPENGGYVRAALASSSLALTWQELDACVSDETHWEATLERFSTYKEQWRQRGVLPMLRRFMHDFAVPARLFDGQENIVQQGERQLTDLLHLAELLQSASANLDGEHALIRYLEEKISQGGEADADGDVSQLRLESDAGLVQIVTVHKSKGLEYPLVFYPYGYYCREVTVNDLPIKYRDAEGRQHVLADPNQVDEAQRAQIQASVDDERLAEDLRKLYVALTRARYATWVAVSPYRTLPPSALGYLLGGAPACAAESLAGSLADLAAGCEHIELQSLPQPRDDRYRSEPQEVASQPVWRTIKRRIQQCWSLSSYSTLSRFSMERVEGMPTLSEFASAQALPDEPHKETFLETWQADEAPAGSEPGLPAEPVAGFPDQDGIHAFPKGAKAGSFLHDLLEWMIREGPQQILADPAMLYEHVERRCRSRRWHQHSDAVVAWLQDFFTRGFRISSNEDEPDLVLGALEQVLPEMEFWFGVEDVDLAALDALVSRNFLVGQPRATLNRGHLHGLLRGFIDLVFEHYGRYYVADYKSNWLGETAQAYESSSISRAILEHRYDLQSALYLFALHRLLKSRLGAAYDYDRHVGGALVFFVRGSRSASQGLHLERPRLEVIEQMEALFSGKSAGGAPSDRVGQPNDTADQHHCGSSVDTQKKGGACN